MNVNRFITRINSYAVKLLSNGAARIYIKNNEALRAANFFADKTIRRTGQGSRRIRGRRDGRPLGRRAPEDAGRS